MTAVATTGPHIVGLHNRYAFHVLNNRRVMQKVKLAHPRYTDSQIVEAAAKIMDEAYTDSEKANSRSKALALQLTGVAGVFLAAGSYMLARRDVKYAKHAGQAGTSVAIVALLGLAGVALETA